MNKKQIMKKAHEIRKNAAHKFNCPASEIIFSECLKMAWEQVSDINSERTLGIKISATDRDSFYLILGGVKKLAGKSAKFNSTNKTWEIRCDGWGESVYRKQARQLAEKFHGSVEFNRT